MTKPSSESPLGIVIVNFGSHDLVRENFAWTTESSFPVRVFVVDNFKSSADAAAISGICDLMDWTLVQMSTNVGFGHGVNIGAQQAWNAGCQVVLIVNPDVAIGEAAAAALGRACGESPNDLVAPLVVGPDGLSWSRLGTIDLAAGRLWNVEVGDGPRWLSGACLCVHRDMWSKIGGLDDDYFLYWEDVDLSYRVVASGGRLTVREDLVAVHAIGGTQDGDGGKSTVYYFYNCRNRLLFAKKNLGWRLQVRWVARSLADVRRVINRGSRTTRSVKVRKALIPSLSGCAAGVWWMIVPARLRNRKMGTPRDLAEQDTSLRSKATSSTNDTE